MKPRREQLLLQPGALPRKPWRLPQFPLLEQDRVAEVERFAAHAAKLVVLPNFGESRSELAVLVIDPRGLGQVRERGRLWGGPERNGNEK